MTILGLAAVGTAAAVVLGWGMWLRLEKAYSSQAWRSFVVWAVKGLIPPVLAWLVLNVPVVFHLPPVDPLVARLPVGSAAWFNALSHSTGWVLLHTAAWWFAMTLLWIGIEALRRAPNRWELAAVGAVWGLVGLAPAVALIWHGGMLWAGFACAGWLGLVVHVVLNGYEQSSTSPPKPSYARAIANLKREKVAEAEWAILEQLERKEDDFDGWLMLAELYATRLGDLAGAERIVCELVLQPNVNPSQIAQALHRLADWQLAVGQDPDGARATLEVICQRYPGTHLARMARLRIQRLPVSREELVEQRRPKRVRLPALRDTEEPTGARPGRSSQEAEAHVQVCLERLHWNPNDVAAREELARTLAEDLGRVEAAIKEVEQLLSDPEAPPERRAVWLECLAGWHLRLRRDEATARKYLDELARDYAHTQQGFAAQRRLKAMEMEERLRQTSQRHTGSPKASEAVPRIVIETPRDGS